MEIQSLIVALIVAAAALFLGVRWYRTLALARRSKDDAGCAGGCGCGKA
jgi:hypothetical protein